MAGNAGTTVLARLYADDGLYEGGATAALRLPTFTGNHDFGRFAWLVQRARPQAGKEEVLQRVMLSNAMLFLLRGVPVVYYGDEQGMIGHGVDQAARQDMFASQVSSYNDQGLLGTKSTTASANYDALHPLYRQIAALASLRKQYVELRRGRQVVRAQSRQPGLFAASRIGNDGREILLVFNTSTAPITAQVEIETDTRAFTPLQGDCPKPDAPGTRESDGAGLGLRRLCGSGTMRRHAVRRPEHRAAGRCSRASPAHSRSPLSRAWFVRPTARSQVQLRVDPDGRPEYSISRKGKPLRRLVAAGIHPRRRAQARAQLQHRRRGAAQFRRHLGAALGRAAIRSQSRQRDARRRCVTSPAASSWSCSGSSMTAWDSATSFPTSRSSRR